MIIRILKNLAGPDCSFWPDSIVDVRDDAVAQSWIDDGAAEPVTPGALPIDAIIRVHQPVAA